MDTINRLKNHVLIATPSVHDIGYQHAVIYICEHLAEGSVGLMINKPLSYPLGFIFEQLNIEPISLEQKNRPLLFGGPRQPERGFVIHKPSGHWQSSLLLAEDIAITTSTDIIRAFAQNIGPKDALITLGFVGWSSQQLEKELLGDNWLVCSYKSELIYEIPFEQRWGYAASLIGVNIDNLIEGGGHA
jgi:putative transcriptional regulator